MIAGVHNDRWIDGCHLEIFKNKVGILIFNMFDMLWYKLTLWHQL